MIDEQHGRTAIDDLAQVAPEHLALHRVEARRGLVQAEEARRRRERPCDPDELPLGLRQLGRHRLASVRKPEEAKRVVDLIGCSFGPRDDLPERTPHRRVVRGDRDVLAHRQVVEQLDRLPGAREPKSGPRVRTHARQVATVEGNGAPVVDEARDRIDERRLPGPVRPDQSHELPGLDYDVDVGQGVNPAEADRYTACLEDGVSLLDHTDSGAIQGRSSCRQ